MPTQPSTLNSERPGEESARFVLTFLGTGTSQGVPMIGCDCDVCRSDDPRDKRLRSSVYIETPDTAFVVDTGTDFRTQALRENIRRVDAVVFTHSHTDHIMGFDDLRRFSWQRGSMPVYASPETMRDLERVYRFAFQNENHWPGYLKPEPHLVDAPFQLGSTSITPLPVPHGHTMVNGYLFSRDGDKLVAYLSDCSAVPQPIIEQTRHVRALVIDGLRPKPHPTHLSVDQAIEISSLVAPNETYLTHIAHELPHSFDSQLPPHVHLAYDGLRLRF